MPTDPPVPQPPATDRADRIARLRPLADAPLAARLVRLAARERCATALLVAHLAELASRDLHLAAGFSSLFAYCRVALRYSEHDAFNRVEAARAARRIPTLVQQLATGGVNLTALRLLAPHLTPENHIDVLESARGKRRAEVEEIVARLAPFPEAPTLVRRLPAPGCVPPTAAVALAPSTSPAVSPPPEPAPASWRVAAQPHELKALAPDRYRLRLTIPGSTLEKFRLAKDMLRHAIPSGDEAAILERALTVLLADLARSKFAATDRPRAGRDTAAGSRHIPAEVKRAVWLRDFGRCSFTSPDGRRCDERAFVEFHHVRPYASDGEASVENIELRCRRHNAYESRRFFVHRQA